MAQHRKPIPKEYTQWLDDYLTAQGIERSVYPDNLSTEQWKRLRGAFRQKQLQDKRAESVTNTITLKSSNKSVTNTLESLQTEIVQLKETMRQREVAYNTLSGNLNTEIKQLKARPHECQCFKKDGNKCTKNATHELKKDNLMIYLCPMHYKTVTA